MLQVVDMTLYWIQVVFIFFANLYAEFSFFKSKNYYLGQFIWYTRAGIILFIISSIFLLFDFKNFNEKNAFISLGNLSLIYQFIYFSYFIYRNRITDKFILFLFSVFFFCFVVLLYFFTKFDFTYTYIKVAIPIASIGLIIFCANYFFQLLTVNDNDLNYQLNTFPVFWIIVGIFISMGFLLPIPFAEHLLKANSYIKYKSLLHIISYFSFILMHLFFIKAYKCALQK